jgi:hypothetical protein
LRSVPTELFEIGSGAIFQPSNCVGFVRDEGAIRFARWVAERGGGGMRDAGLFVLSVWNSSDDWSEWLARDDGPMGGRFDVHRALGNWDPEHRAAFCKWAAAPWWL